jgi:hypothetical protein
MATRKTLREEIKLHYVEVLKQALCESEEVLRVGSNELAFPVVDKEGNEDFVVLTIKIPTGSRDGDPYDGYAMAQEYEMKLQSKAEKAKVAAEKKAKKIEKDKKMREAKAKAKAEREQA